jgi:signal transduction histidine kinase
MKNNVREFAGKYRAALGGYIQGQSNLDPARALGEQALAAGFEMLDLARVHEEALSSAALLSKPGASLAREIRKASLFFAEVITPIERTHRGAQEAAVELGQLNQILHRRTAELAASNQELKAEIRRRAQIEKALRKSERHHRELLKDSGLLQEQLRYLSRQILSAQEEERKKISRELHDQIAAALTGINLELNDLKAEVSGNNNALRRKIASTQRLVQNSVEVIHRFARELRPMTLDDLGLIPALHSFTKTLSKQIGIRIALTIFAAVEELDIGKRTILYRVAQEALTNIAKHAAATRIEVNIIKRGDAVILSVKDDGKSFNVERLLYNDKNRRLGLLGMRERIEMVGGRFTVDSVRGRGTSVHASIPIENVKGNGSSTRAAGKHVRIDR